MPGLIPIHSGEIFLDAVTDNSYFPDIQGVIPADVDCTHRSKMWGKAGREFNFTTTSRIVSEGKGRVLILLYDNRILYHSSFIFFPR